MRKLCTFLFAFFATVLWAGTSCAQITTVMLSEDTSGQFVISSEEKPTQSKTLQFKFKADATIPESAIIEDWVLRVVAMTEPDNRRPQDVAVLAADNKQIGQWSAYGKNSQPYRVELQPESWASKPTIALTLQSKSSDTTWRYCGGNADNISDRPRLIVTYELPARPNPVRSGQSTDWTYAKPTSSFFSSRLGNLNGKTLLTNPVSYNGAVFVVAGSPNATRLYRLAATGTAEWPLSVPTTAGSFASITAWGSLKVITKNDLYSCDLTQLSSPGTPAECAAIPVPITVNFDETPAMGSDGSLYFKNVEANGSIVAFNPSRQEIWRTKFKLTKASPIALSANGRYAYLLAEIDLEAEGRRISLLRIDTATGETVEKEIVGENGVKPLLVTLLRPAVVSKEINGRNVDYVFVAGNESATGILQLVLSDPSDKTETVSPLWTLKGKVATEPVLSVDDGNSLFVVQDGKLLQYDWFGANGPYGRDKLQPKVPVAIGEGTALLVDGSDSVYRPPAGYRGVQFTSDGAIIGYEDNAVYDISPNSGTDLSPEKLSSRTIYGGQTVTVSPDAANGLAQGAEVILKGNSIKLPNGFHWPLGATLKLQSVQQ